MFQIDNENMDLLIPLLNKENSHYPLLKSIISNKKKGKAYVDCFRIEKDIIKDVPISSIKYELCNIELINWKLFKSFWDFKPSWQNSIESIIAVPNSFEVIIAKIDEDTVGYGIIDTITGDIPQLAVHMDYRRKGIGCNILKRLIQHTESQKVSFINIDNKYLSIFEFLQNLRVENFIDQYEMMLNI